MRSLHTTGTMGKATVAALLLSLLASAWSASDFRCPAKDGQYEDPHQCDKYYLCEDGRATEKLCPDGLVFDPLNRKVNKCDQPFSVDCGDRQELQPAQSNKLCPRRNGYFAHPDPGVCNIFYNCIEGDAIEITCPTGLYFDEYAGNCVWPKSADREGCNAKPAALKDGFSCPKEPQIDSTGRAADHPKYSHPDDCQKFYVCLNGVTPREQGCPLGEVYNEERLLCDDPENVPGCENWYEGHPDLEKGKKPAKQTEFISTNPKRKN